MEQKIQYTESLEDNVSLMNHFHLAITWTRQKKKSQIQRTVRYKWYGFEGFDTNPSLDQTILREEEEPLESKWLI